MEPVVIVPVRAGAGRAMEPDRLIHGIFTAKRKGLIRFLHRLKNKQ